MNLPAQTIIPEVAHWYIFTDCEGAEHLCLYVGHVLRPGHHGYQFYVVAHTPKIVTLFETNIKNHVKDIPKLTPQNVATLKKYRRLSSLPTSIKKLLFLIQKRPS